MLRRPTGDGPCYSSDISLALSSGYVPEGPSLGPPDRYPSSPPRLNASGLEAQRPPPGAGALPLGRRIPRPGWLLFENQQASFCAVHALSHILQGELPPFTVADLREGAERARLADVEAGFLHEVDAHEDAGGNFSYQAVGYALSHRRFDWRGVTVCRSRSGVVDATATVDASFAPMRRDQGKHALRSQSSTAAGAACTLCIVSCGRPLSALAPPCVPVVTYRVVPSLALQVAEIFRGVRYAIPCRCCNTGRFGIPGPLHRVGCHGHWPGVAHVLAAALVSSRGGRLGTVKRVACLW